MASYHMHHTLEHMKAIVALERHRCLFLSVPGYNPERPFDHIPPRTTCVYFALVLHLTEVWTCVKMDFEEYQNQVVPQLWCYNYYRKAKQEPGQGKLELLAQVKDQAMFAAQQWENASSKEHHVLSTTHLAIKPQLDSIAGIYKTYAQRVIIIPEVCVVPWSPTHHQQQQQKQQDSLANGPWPSMPSSNQKWFMDLISANCLPGLGFYSVAGPVGACHGRCHVCLLILSAAAPETRAPLEDSLLVAARTHNNACEPVPRYGSNELRIAAHHLCPSPGTVLTDHHPWQDGQVGGVRVWCSGHSFKKPDPQRSATVENFLSTLHSKERWNVLHFAGASNARRALFAGGEELTVSAIRAMEKFPSVELAVLTGWRGAGL